MKKYFYANDIENLLKTVEFILAKDYYKENVNLSFDSMPPERIEIKCTRPNNTERVLYNRNYLVDFIESNSICTIANTLYYDLYFYHDTGMTVDSLGVRR